MKLVFMRVTSVCAVSLLLLACSPEHNSEIGTAAQSTADTPKGLDYAFYMAAVEPLFLRPRGGSSAPTRAALPATPVRRTRHWDYKPSLWQMAEFSGLRNSRGRTLPTSPSWSIPVTLTAAVCLMLRSRRQPEAKDIQAAFFGTAGTTVNTGLLRSGLPPAPTAQELTWSRR